MAQSSYVGNGFPDNSQTSQKANSQGSSKDAFINSFRQEGERDAALAGNSFL